LGSGYGFDAGWADLEIAFGTASALRGGITQAGCDEALFFEAVERGVKRAGRGFAAGSGLDFRPDGDSVGIAAYSQNCEKSDLFELA
jgi:hypothetical protein